jgi:hypothetical protein
MRQLNSNGFFVGAENMTSGELDASVIKVEKPFDGIGMSADDDQWGKDHGFINGRED